MSGWGWLLLLGLLAVALAAIALLRRRGRPAVEAGPKAPGKRQADPALSPATEIQGAPLRLVHPEPEDPVAQELEERERRAGGRT